MNRVKQNFLLSFLLASMMVALAAAATLTSSSRNALAQPAGVCGPMDVAFIIDDTGSMGGAIDNVKLELANILADINTASGGSHRLALVGLRSLSDFSDEVSVRENFAPNNDAAMTVAINALLAGGGGGFPEISDEALNTVISGLPAAGRDQNIDFTPAYNPASLKIAILVTDALPAGFDDSFTGGVDDVNANQRALDAAAAGVKISAVYVPTGGIDGTIQNIMQNYATVTGGQYVETAANGQGTGQAIRDIINNCGEDEPADGPDLIVTKVAKPGQGRPVAGGYYSFILTVKNVGNQPTPAGKDVMLRDDLSGIGTFSFYWASAGTCANNPPYVDCRRSRMAPGEEWRVEIRVRLHRNGCTLVNTAIVDRWNIILEANENNNTATLPVNVCP